MLAVADPPADPRTGAPELDAARVRLAAAGDPDACRALVELYQARVFALASRMLVGRGRATVEDCAQDTFLHVFRKLSTFDAGASAGAGGAKLSTWILTIAARRAIDELRRARPTLVADLDPEDPARATRRELVAAIERALAELSPPLRAAFLLREYHGLDYAEIARALDIDLGTVKSRLARARAALRDQLAEVKP